MILPRKSVLSGCLQSHNRHFIIQHVMHFFKLILRTETPSLCWCIQSRCIQLTVFLNYISGCYSCPELMCAILRHEFCEFICQKRSRRLNLIDSNKKMYLIHVIVYSLIILLARLMLKYLYLPYSLTDSTKFNIASCELVLNSIHRVFQAADTKFTVFPEAQETSENILFNQP